MSTSKDRILEFLRVKGLGQGAFEKKVGLSNGYVNNSKGSFGAKKIDDILKAFPELNERWLLTGEGEMFKSNVDKRASDQDDYLLVIKQLSGQIKQMSDQISELIKQIGANGDRMEVLHGIIEHQRREIDDLRAQKNNSHAENGKVAAAG